MLNALHSQGMTSKGQGCTKLHDEAILKTGLPKSVIKDWIGNKNRIVSGKRYEYPKVSYSKGMTSFNCFIHEKKGEVGGMESWGQAWKEVPDQEKKSYKDKAKLQQANPADPQKRSAFLLKKLDQMYEEIQM